ncbi:NfeD family protein [Aerosakkonema funiforme]|uniref:NfeD family protein n=1 Tax=Aerosakkonema funiforme TaxID=1246630 RepID=UPI0035BB81C5
MVISLKLGEKITNFVKRFSEDNRQNQTANFYKDSSTVTDLKKWELEAIVDLAIQPYKSGRVYFRGSWWPARCEQEITLLPGQIVYVIGMSNITLLVEPFASNILRQKVG